VPRALSGVRKEFLVSRAAAAEGVHFWTFRLARMAARDVQIVMAAAVDAGFHKQR